MHRWLCARLSVLGVWLSDRRDGVCGWLMHRALSAATRHHWTWQGLPSFGRRHGNTTTAGVAVVVATDRSQPVVGAPLVVVVVVVVVAAAAAARTTPTCQP